jgi:hypothetical protein
MRGGDRVCTPTQGCSLLPGRHGNLAAARPASGTHRQFPDRGAKAARRDWIGRDGDAAQLTFGHVIYPTVQFRQAEAEHRPDLGLPGQL